MALQFENLTVPLTQGVETKSDPKQLPNGKLLALTNATFQSPGRLKKRPGHTAMPTAAAGLSNIATGSALATYGQELLELDGTSVYSWNAPQSKWYQKGAVFPLITVSQQAAIRDPGNWANPDVAFGADGSRVVAGSELLSACAYYCVSDAATNAVLQYQQLTGCSAVKTLALGKYLLVFCVTSAHVLEYTALDTTNGYSRSAATPIATLSASSPFYDAEVINGQCIIAYNAAASVGVVSLSATLALGTPATFTGPASAAIAVFIGTAGTAVYVAWADGTNLRYTAYDPTLTSVLKAPTTIVAEAACDRIGGCRGPTQFAADTFVCWTHYTAATHNYITYVAGVDTTQSAFGVLCRSVGLSGKPVYVASQSAIFVPVTFTTTQQSTSFLLRATLLSDIPHVVAKALYGVSGSVTRYAAADGPLPETNIRGGNVLSVATLVNDILLDVRGLLFSEPSINLTSYTLQAAPPVQQAELGGALQLSGGGFLAFYDGYKVIEHGFFLYPEPISVPNPGGANVYSYVACYEWMDHTGAIHRSAPSPAVTQAQPAAIDGTHTVAVTIPTLRVTNNPPLGAAPTIQIVVYRTIAAGTIYYAVNQLGTVSYNPVANTIGADTVTFTDGSTDAAIQANPQLYTTGGVVDNVSPGCVGAMARYANRVFAVDSENPLQLWRSHQVVQGQPVEFSDETKMSLDARLVAVVALAVLDDKLIVFGASAIAVLTGQGPDRTGANDDMGSGYVLPADVGCTQPQSVVQASTGIGFMSSKGYYLLDRSLNVTYVGADIESYNASQIVGAIIDPVRTQARLMLSTGTELVYDDRAGQWSTYADAVPVPVADSLVWQGVPVHLRTDGVVWKETAGAFTDPTGDIALSFQTGWISLNGLSGYQRVRGLALLGDWISAHSLTVTVESAVDGYDSPVTDTYSITATTGPEQWRIPHLKTQKAQAIRVTVTETAGTGEGLSLSAISLEVGVKKGLAKLPAARSM